MSENSSNQTKRPAASKALAKGRTKLSLSSLAWLMKASWGISGPPSLATGNPLSRGINSQRTLFGS